MKSKSFPTGLNEAHSRANSGRMKATHQTRSLLFPVCIPIAPLFSGTSDGELELEGAVPVCEGDTAVDETSVGDGATEVTEVGNGISDPFGLLDEASEGAAGGDEYGGGSTVMLVTRVVSAGDEEVAGGAGGIDEASGVDDKGAEGS